MSFKTTLASMTFARWIIVLGGAGSLGLGFSGWHFYSKRVELEAALEPDSDVERTLRNIQSLGKTYTKLRKDLGGENLKAQDDMATYISRCAADPLVNLGSVVVTAQTPVPLQGGVVDLKYAIKPQSSDKGQPRANIANFLYKLELDSRRVRVTNLHIWQEQKFKEWEIGNDKKWKWESEVTTRQKEEPKEPKR